MFEWITNNVAALTLFTTLLLILITLYYTILNRRMLEVSSRPCVLIDPKGISLAPDINFKCNTEALKKALKERNIEALEETLKEQRIWFNIDVDIANLSNSPAQDVFLDAEVHFIIRKPFEHAWLPINKPKHLNFISSESSSKGDNKQTINICFDNFVVREMLYDFCDGRKQLEGHAVHASHDEIQNKKLWTSPKIVLSCYYKDIQSINYCSEYQFFFHLYFDESESKLKCYILNIEDLGFIGIKKIRPSYKKKHLKKIRHLRYISFWGKKFSKKDLVVLRRAK